jgi:hypothetical protein
LVSSFFGLQTPQWRRPAGSWSGERPMNPKSSASVLRAGEPAIKQWTAGVRGNFKCPTRKNFKPGRSATCDDMAHSLSPECTPLKQAYDSCFNAWFAGYLEPTLTPHQQREKDKNPQEYQRQKAEEYQQKCGKVWEGYRECVKVRFLPSCSTRHALTRSAHVSRKRSKRRV